jgi:hypothetical protein
MNRRSCRTLCGCGRARPGRVVQAGLLSGARRVVFPAAAAFAETGPHRGSCRQFRRADPALDRALRRPLRKLAGAIACEIPGQHSVALEETNPSLLLLAREIADRVGFAGSKVVVFGTYGIAAIALVLAPLSFTRCAIGEERFANPRLLAARLDRWLIDNPRLSLRITVLAMYALYLCSPRLKEYAFFELALYAAVLVVGLRPPALATLLACGIAVPTLASLTGNAFVDSFGLLATALICFWIMLADFRAQAADAGGRHTSS